MDFQRNHPQCRLFMVLNAIDIILALLELFKVIFQATEQHQFKLTNKVLILMAKQILAILLSLYFFVCIHSLYEKLKTQSQTESIQQPEEEKKCQVHE